MVAPTPRGRSKWRAASGTSSPTVTRSQPHGRPRRAAPEFKNLLAGAGVKLLRLPACSPDLNAYAERFVRSIRQECLRHIVPLGAGHLDQVVREYVEQ